MLLEEFIALTGYRPTCEEYAEIERNYMAFDGDKQMFCKAWVMVNSATVAKNRADYEALGKMLDKELELREEISYMDSVINQVHSHLESLKKKREKLQTSALKLHGLITEHKKQMRNF